MTTATVPLETSPAKPPRLAAKVVVLYALVIGTIVACWVCKPPATASLAGVEMKLPGELLGFAGKDQEISDGERVLLPKDTEFAKKVYSDAIGESVNMQIVLTGVDRRSIHRPEVCLRGQGWTVRSAEVTPVPLESGKIMNVMLLDISRQITGASGKTSELSALYAYWFVSADAQTPYHLERIARTNIDLLLHNKAHRWAYVIVMAPILKGFIRDGKDRTETLAMIENFIRTAVPTFQKSEMPLAKHPSLPAASAAIR